MALQAGIPEKFTIWWANIVSTLQNTGSTAIEYKLQKFTDYGRRQTLNKQFWEWFLSIKKDIASGMESKARRSMLRRRPPWETVNWRESQTEREGTCIPGWELNRKETYFSASSRCFIPSIWHSGPELLLGQTLPVVSATRCSWFFRYFPTPSFTVFSKPKSSSFFILYFLWFLVALSVPPVLTAGTYQHKWKSFIKEVAF